ncbi:hypothetical protein ACFWN2_08130 [Lentzea sp. NPDC058436]|uniref:hypothetical protein n=1 Tax=Lentzea sp. NPDC058436 TaxID=3346499 RepID=UPI00366747A9
MRTTGRISIITCLAALLSLTAPPAQAAPQAPAAVALPAVGAVVTLKLSAPGTEIKIGAKSVKVDLSGDVVLRVVAGDADPLKAVRLRVLDLNLAGKLPKGDVTIRPIGYDVAAAGELRLNVGVPPTLNHSLVLGFRIVVNQPEISPKPIELSSKDVARLAGKLKTFPPLGDLHQLQDPVDLIDDAKPSVTAGVIAKLGLKVG